jgi:hypothetical protein
MYVAVGPKNATVLQGDSSTFVADVSSSGAFSGVPQLTINNAAPGIAARVTVTQTSASIAKAAIVVNVGAEVQPGLYVLWLVASDPGANAVSTEFSIRVVFRTVECTLTELCLQWARSATASSEYTPDEWGAHQATGAPNVGNCNDDARAWASAGPDDGQWLELDFEYSVFPTEVEVFENYGTSAIVKVEVKDESSAYHTVYSAAAKIVACPRVLTIPVTNVSVRVRGVRIHLNQGALGDWSEVDAVKLVGYRQR